MLLMNNIFDEIYVINLLRRPDKLTKVLWQLNKINIHPHVIEAVDGHHPSIYYKHKKLLNTISVETSRLSVGAYGYILSWEKVIEDAINNQYKRILVLDDDIILIRNFVQLFDNWIEKLNKYITKYNKNQWKLLLLGATQHTQRPELITNFQLAYHPERTDGSFAVGIDNSIYGEILTQLITHIQIVDSDILRQLYLKYREQCYVAYPNLMIADVTQSDIRSGRSQEELAQKVGWSPLSNYQIPYEKPLVSIIISCYNAEKTIKRCLQSMIEQTYRPIELIITDDGSTDKTFDIIVNILNKWQYDKRIRDMKIILHRHSINKGSFVSRNMGLSKITGDLITFQDADDISLNYRIDEQVNKLLEKNVNFTCCLILRTHLDHLSENPEQLLKDIQQTRIHTNKYCCRSKVGLITTMFRKEIIHKLGKYKELKWAADAEYIRRLFPKLDSKYEIMNYLNETDYIPKMYYRIPEIMYLSYEMTENNLTNQRLKANKRKTIP